MIGRKSYSLISSCLASKLSTILLHWNNNKPWSRITTNFMDNYTGYYSDSSQRCENVHRHLGKVANNQFTCLLPERNGMAFIQGYTFKLNCRRPNCSPAYRFVFLNLFFIILNFAHGWTADSFGKNNLVKLGLPTYWPNTKYWHCFQGGMQNLLMMSVIREHVTQKCFQYWYQIIIKRLVTQTKITIIYPRIILPESIVWL